METLGLFSQLYMWILVVLLFIGIGMGILGFINHITDKLLPANTSRVNKPVIKDRAGSGPALVKDSKTQTGIPLDNDWLRFSAFSFLVLLVIVTITGLFSLNNKPRVDKNHLFNQNASYMGYSGNGISSLGNLNHYHPYGYDILNNNLNNGYSDQFNFMINPYINQQYLPAYGSLNNNFQNNIMIPQPNGFRNGLHNHIPQNYQW